MSLFKKKPSGFDEQEKQGATKSSGSLIVLLVLLGGFAYLYFFTSLIVPHEASTPANAPTVATEVKQSMPPKPAEQGAPPATAVMKPEEAKSAVAPLSAGNPASLPAPAAATAKAAAPVPVPAIAKPAVPAPVTAKPAVPAEAKPAAASPVTTAPKKTAVTEKRAEPKAATAAQQKGAAKSAKISAPPAAKPAAMVKTEAYSVSVGEFPAGSEAAAVETKIARLGIKPVSRTENRKSRTMYRLFYGVYTDYDVYLAELGKLRQSTKGAFGVEKDGTYFLYAGSFSARERVEKERKDLAAKGVALQIQPTVLALATVKLTAGPFSSKKEADKAAAKMKGAGLAARVVPQRR